MVLDGVVDPARSYADTTLEQAKSFDDDLERLLRPLPSRFDLRVRERRRPGCRLRRSRPPDRRRIRARRPSTVSTALSVPASSTSGSRARCTREPTATTTSRPRSRRPPAATAAACSRWPTSTPVAPRAASTRTRPRRSTRPAASMRRLRRALRPCSSWPRARGAAAPHFGASTVWLGLPCTFWPVPAEGKVGTDPRARRAADRPRRHDRRSGDAVRVGAGAGPRAAIGAAPYRRGNESHLIRSGQRLRRRHGRPLSPLARRARARTRCA